ncbi:MAG TPA: ZIP family metal transporter [Candidatus Avacidaminococcus intestinavium]|uniref:ZIP family metal transporter n=1 Tax=Candidatus Avacidaminococcus intestinavium TaxID=2840684 RepID=A0A9D1SME8_9FIRM|nr:ZIP family metal transporter [Candidatus Avacidaminococcus intestinavium]
MLEKINDPIILTIIATFFTWGMTALGASLVFFFKTINKKVLNMMLGFAAGVMVAASFWSLLAPAIAMAENRLLPAWLIAAIGFVSGAGFLVLADKVMPHIHFFSRSGEPEGITTSWRRTMLLLFSITLHNIPEGLAVGVAFGAAAQNMNDATLLSAIAVALGIGIQNFPEGAAVSIPLRREGLSRWKSFLYGQASAIVEPIAGIIGAMLVTTMQEILPYALAFAAGAMIFVVVEDLIPESQTSDEHGSADRSSYGFIIGFTIMMILDVALG